MTKTLSALFAAVALSFATSAFAAAPASPLTFPAKNGPVTFEHSKHAALKCTQCHASDKGGKIEGFGKDKAHALCQECHKKEGKGPQKCNDCHKK